MTYIISEPFGKQMSINPVRCRKVKSVPTMRAVDRWVRAAFSRIFRGLEFSRFDGESVVDPQNWTVLKGL